MTQQIYCQLETESLTFIIGLSSPSIIAWEVTLPFGQITKHLWVLLVKLYASCGSCLAAALGFDQSLQKICWSAINHCCYHNMEILECLCYL